MWVSGVAHTTTRTDVCDLSSMSGALASKFLTPDLAYERPILSTPPGPRLPSTGHFRDKSIDSRHILPPDNTYINFHLVSQGRHYCKCTAVLHLPLTCRGPLDLLK